MRPFRLDRVVLVNDFSISRGGATSLVFLLAKLLRERDIPVTLICGDSAKDPGFRDLGVDVVSLGQVRLLEGSRGVNALRGLNNDDTPELVLDWVRRNDTERTIYHTHVWSQIFSPSLFGALAGVSARTVIHAHDYFHACPNGAYMDFQRDEICSRPPLGLGCLVTQCDRRFYSHKLWRVARQLNLRRQMGSPRQWGRFILLHDKMLASFLRAGYPSDVFDVLRNPAQRFSAERIRAESNARFCFIGRLDTEKGPQDALAACRRAGVTLDVMGDGPLMDGLVREYPEMRFHGWCSREDIATRVQHCRALLVPSRVPEPFGLVVAEAAGSGLPVIITNKALLSEEVSRLEIGYACDTSNLNEFQTCISEVVRLSVAEMRDMSVRAMENWEKFATTEATWCEQMLTMYSDVLEQSVNAGRRIEESKTV